MRHITAQRTGEFQRRILDILKRHTEGFPAKSVLAQLAEELPPKDFGTLGICKQARGQAVRIHCALRVHPVGKADGQVFSTKLEADDIARIKRATLRLANMDES